MGRPTLDDGPRARAFQWPPCDLSGCAESATRRGRVADRSPARQREEEEMRAVGSDVHLEFCEVAIADGAELGSAGRIATRPEEMGSSLEPWADDRVGA